MNDGIEVGIDIVIKEDLNKSIVFKLNILIKMYMSNGNIVF